MCRFQPCVTSGRQVRPIAADRRVRVASAISIAVADIIRLPRRRGGLTFSTLTKV
jgi:hypothetical protein